jgi:hypothetical protein
MKRRGRSRPIDDFNSLLLAGLESARCMNAEFLVHLERAVREIRREQVRLPRRSVLSKRVALPHIAS